MRKLTKLAAAAICAVLVSGPVYAQGKIVISNWDGYMPVDLLENFTKETGIEAEISLHATNEEIMGKLTASGGRGFDVVFVSSPFAEVLHKLGIAAEIDSTKIPNLDNLYPEARQLAYDPGNKFQVPYAWGTTGLCYRSDLVSEAPDSWWDLLDPSDALKGKMTMLSTDRWLMASAQLAHGYSVNTTDEAELEQVKSTLINAKKNLLSYDDTTFYAKLVSGEATLVQAWDGWCNYGIAENPDIKYVIAKEGTDTWVDTMVIIKSSSNLNGAHAFINYVLSADVGIWVASNILYKTPNKAAMESLDAALIEQFPNLGMTAEFMLQNEVTRDVGDAQKAYSRLITEVMAAQ